MLLEIIIVMVVLLILGTYYLVAVPALTNLMNVVTGNAAVQEAGRASIGELLYTIAIYFVPVTIAVGIIIWLFVSGAKEERSSYRRIRR